MKTGTSGTNAPSTLGFDKGNKDLVGSEGDNELALSGWGLNLSSTVRMDGYQWGVGSCRVSRDAAEQKKYRTEGTHATVNGVSANGSWIKEQQMTTISSDATRG
jgi:hypothetical protein